MAVRQVQIAVPTDDNGFQVLGMGAGSVLAQEGRGLIQSRALYFRYRQEFLCPFGAAHVLTVVIKFFANRPVQIIQLLLVVAGPGGALQVSLPASQLVVDLVVPNRGLGGTQLFNANFQDIAGLGVQIGGIAWWLGFFDRRWSDDGWFCGLRPACARSAVTGRQGQRKQGDTQKAEQVVASGVDDRERREIHGPLG